MKWWDDLWLNEGFASYAEYIGTNKIFPEWRMIDQFINSKTMPALKTDALSTSHTLSVTVNDPADIEAIFDAISYNKVNQTQGEIWEMVYEPLILEQGAAILYMLQRVLGEDMMRHGLQLYLKEHQYANANTDDLWQALSLGSLNSSHHVETKVITFLMYPELLFFYKGFIGDHGQLDPPAGLPPRHAAPPRQPDPRVPKTLCPRQLDSIARRRHQRRVQLVPEVVHPAQLHHERQRQPREPDLDARERR